MPDSPPVPPPVYEYDAVWRGPFAALGILTNGAQVIRVDILGCQTRARTPQRDTVAELACVELNRYLDVPAHTFQTPVHFAGSLHQVSVWQALTRIPAGAPITYGQLARMLGSSAQAVGGACGRNPIPILVPCHRVIAAGGAIGGFMGGRRSHDLAVKEWLLAHEARRGH